MTDTASARFRDSLRGFGPLGLLAIVLVLAGIALTPPIGAAVVLLWVWLSKTPWREIGYVKPRSWIGALAIGVALGIALKLLMKAVVLPLLHAPPVNATFHDIAGNPSQLAIFIAYALVGAGWGEETVFRGWLFERLGKLLGATAPARVLIVAVGAVMFGAAHWQQGLPGMEQGAIIGLIFGALYMLTGRLVTLMIAHAAFDVFAAVIIYFNAETRIAHLVFQ
jgi:hypothetical protein